MITVSGPPPPQAALLTEIALTIKKMGRDGKRTSSQK
jgi:hypothetical protein